MLTFHRRLFARSCALACAISVSLLPASVLAGPTGRVALAIAPANEAAVDVVVELDRPDDDSVAARIRGEIVRSLNAEGIAVVQSPEPGVGTIHVDVRWGEGDNEDNQVLSAFVVVDGDERRADHGTRICEACPTDKLRAEAVALVPSVVPLLPERDDGKTDPKHGDPNPPHDPTGGARNGGPTKFGPLDYTGITLMTVGAAGVIAGGVLVGRGSKSSSDPTMLGTRRETDYRPPGLALIGAGGSVLLIGMALLIAGRVKASKARRGARVVPALSPFGASLAGRF